MESGVLGGRSINGKWVLAWANVESLGARYETSQWSDRTFHLRCHLFDSFVPFAFTATFSLQGRF